MAVTIQSIPSPSNAAAAPHPATTAATKVVSTGAKPAVGLFSEGASAAKFSTDAPEPASPKADTGTNNEDTTKRADSAAQDAFARKERQIRRMQLDLQQQRQDLEAKQTSYDTDYVPKNRLKDEFWTVAEELGLDYDVLTQQMLSQPNDPATRALMNKVRALEQSQTTAQKAQESQQKQAYESAKSQIRTQIDQLVDAGDEFELIKSAGLQDEVLARIEQEFHDSGQSKVMDVKEACSLIENETLEDMYRLSQLKKVQNRLKPQTPIEPTTPAASVASEAPKTITNDMQAAVPGKLSSKDRMARAMAAFNGTLK